MGYNDDDEVNEDELPEAPPIQLVTETFSQVTVSPEDNSRNDSNKK